MAAKRITSLSAMCTEYNVQQMFWVLLAYLPTWNGEYVSIMAVMVIMDEHVPPINTVSSGHEEVLFFMDILSASTPS